MSDDLKKRVEKFLERMIALQRARPYLTSITDTTLVETMLMEVDNSFAKEKTEILLKELEERKSDE